MARKARLGGPNQYFRCKWNRSARLREPKLSGRPVRGAVALCGNVGIRRRRALGAAGGAPIVGQYEVGDTRRDLGAETRTVEHAVVPDALLHPVRLAVGRNV